MYCYQCHVIVLFGRNFLRKKELVIVKREKKMYDVAVDLLKLVSLLLNFVYLKKQFDIFIRYV